MNTSSLLANHPVKPRILIVDDVVQNLQVVGAMLRNEGLDVMPAGSGAQALDRVHARLPDLILLDLMLGSHAPNPRHRQQGAYHRADCSRGWTVMNSKPARPAATTMTPNPSSCRGCWGK